MTTKSKESKSLGMTIYGLLREAQASEAREPRETPRYSFFRTTAIYKGKTCYSGFSRDISPTGIGLLHNFNLIPGQVEISISTECGYSVRIRTQILWCTPCGEGWYISGGKFLGIAGGRA